MRSKRSLWGSPFCLRGAVGLLFHILLIPTIVSAEDVLKTPEAFLQETFGDAVPNRQYLWLTGSVGEGAERILGHRYGKLRVSYWANDETSAWILEEIGKVEPITAGFVVESEQIRTFEVLVYRESHGWEIRYPFFTRQFRGARLDERQRLTHAIDGISGATLSVNAVTRLARLALFLDVSSRKKEGPQ